MKSKVQYSKLAVLDLERVWSEVYEASKSPDISEKYISDLLQKIENKSTFPESGTPLYFQELFTGYYFVVFKTYIAFYRVDGDFIFVDRILFRRSDYITKLLGPTGEEEK